jgi:hypothetical protein
VLGACDDTRRNYNRFDGPTDLAFLEPGVFFEVPVAFASNFRSGRVSKLDLKRTQLIVEDSPAPWMSSPDIAFGADRALGEIALSVREERVDVWVADDSRDQLLRAPYIVALTAEGNPTWQRPELSGEPQWLDAEGIALDAASMPQLSGLRLRAGRATTETWTATWTGHSFELRGSSSGLQSQRAVPGTPYESDFGELAFTASLGGLIPEVGSTVTFHSDSGVEAADAGGLVTDLLAPTPDSDWIFATVLPESGPGFVAVWDALTFVELDRLELPEGASPESLAVGHTEGVLWLADSAEVAGGGRIFRLDYVPGDLDTLALTEVPVPEPAIDVVAGRDPDAPGISVAAAYSDAVWLLDALSLEPVDINPTTAALDPTHVGSLIAGLAASERAVETAILDEGDTRLPAYGVMVTTFGGALYWLDAATGCQVFGTPAGAYLEVTPELIDTTFGDVGFSSNPQLVFDEVSERAVTTHACGGVSRTEAWRVIYQEEQQSYEVEGTLSGVQQNRAREGERYLSDDGSISFLILPGTRPTTDGDRWTFPINDGVTAPAIQELPGRPLVFTELFDDRDGDWWRVREREIAVIPHAGNDVVLWVDIQGQGAGGVRVFQ